MKKRLCAFLLLIILNADLIYSQTPVLQFTLCGDKPNSELGICVGPAGDVNHDGYADFLVTVRGEKCVRLYLGGATFNKSRFVTLMGDTLHSTNFGGTTTSTGSPVSGIGDINGDGYEDFAIGEPDWGDGMSFPGRVWVYYGGKEISTTAAITITGANYRGYFGEVISPAGDVNGDGFADFLIADSVYPEYGYRKVALVLGGSDMEQMKIIEIKKGWGTNYFGASIAGIGDINGDSYDDFIVGEPGVIKSSSQKETTSNVYLYYGGAVVDTSRYLVIHKENVIYFGNQVAKAGDVNRDGKPDFLVFSNGAQYLFTSESEFIKMNYYGFLEGGCDLNKDGYSDFLFYNINTTNKTCSIFGYYGSSNIDTIPKFSLEEVYSKNSLPPKVRFLGDINKDGYTEFVLSVPTYFTNGEVKIYSLGSVADIEKNEGEIPNNFYLNQNYPNPFNPETTIEFVIPKSNYVCLKIYDSLGREIETLINDYMEKGRHKIVFNSHGLCSGVYFYTLNTEQFSQTKKMLILK